jgi:hypothetical protein
VILCASNWKQSLKAMSLSASIDAVMVAEKSSVVRFGGSTSSTAAMSRSKVGSSMRSASSSTRNLVRRSASATPCEERTWSASRPGVATTTCGRLQSATAWCIMSMPPTTVVKRSEIFEPSAANWSWIWNASSRVGVSTSANIP